MTRWTYDTLIEGEIADVPEFVLLGKDQIRTAIGLTQHDHPGCFEFVIVERGKAGWEIDNTSYETFAGQLFHTRPGELHRGNLDVIEPSKFWWIIIKAPLQEGWLNLTASERTKIEKALYNLPRIITTGLKPIETLRRLKYALEKPGPFQSIHIRQSLIDILLLALQPETASSAVADDLHRMFNLLIDRMMKFPDWRPTVQELAAFANVSSAHFYRTFQKYTGLSPMSFIERNRVKEACNRLTVGISTITEISHDLGYQSSQHFATVFKRFTGMTPTRWKKGSD
ncbi:MAG: hypothetical protein JWM44_4273 [Bacilli bacterium]|nr:hypothetical protein [Bacilli bacterium]